MVEFRTYFRAATMALGLTLAVPMMITAPHDAGAQEAIGYLVPSSGTLKGASKTGAALRGSLNAANGSIGGRAVGGRPTPGGIRVAGIPVSGVPLARGRSAANVAGTDKWGRPDKRYTGQRCESIEAGVRVFRGC